MSARLLLLAALILVVGFAPAPFPKRQRETKKALIDQMQGWWAHTHEVESGRQGPLWGLRIHIEGKTLQYYVGQNKADGWTITVDPTTNPPSLDKTRLGTTNDKLLGRVSVEGDVLKIGWYTSLERPPDLSGSKGRAITLKRERK
jgi:hypothetical protein